MAVARQRTAMTSRGDGDVEAVLAGHAVGLAAQAVDDVAELAVVHVDDALPRDLARVDAELVALLDVVSSSAASRLLAAPMAWKSPVKCRLISSMGTTWA